MKKIIFVCTGNVCRSPMAEYYFNKKIKYLEKDNEYIASSCGINAKSGEPATYNAVEAMKKYNVDISEHRARKIYDLNVLDFDLIITLTKQHKFLVENMYPEIKGNVYTLKEFVNPNSEYLNIDDPWGLDDKVYEQCAKDIVEYVDKLIDKILRK